MTTTYDGTMLDDVITQSLNTTGGALVNPLDDAKIFGYEGNDTLQGSTLQDFIDGGTGGDRLTGGGGFAAGSSGDVYVVDDLGDRVIADGIGDFTGGPNSTTLGVNTIFSFINLDLLVDPIVESGNVYNLILSGNARTSRGNNLTNYLEGNELRNTLSGAGGTDYLYGFEQADTLDGGDGNDFLDGGTGADTFITSLGRDSYYVDNVGDRVIGNLGGTHHVFSTVNFNLNTNALGVRDLTLMGTAPVNGIGNSGTNFLRGNDNSNRLTGLEGNDYLYGNGRNDVLVGGAGNDQLAGGAGLDRFSFSGVGNFSQLGVDTLLDFSSGDRVELSKNLFTAFSSLNVGAVVPRSRFAIVANDTLVASNPAEIVYSAGSRRLIYNANGNADGLGDGGAFARFQTPPILASNSFVIVA